ncbi:sensor domain-containing diguanylate cyclase [Marinomonas algarum]|uniref:diguanylate cyclase n=1 Tax=Marinomonas algarum TaxID=2883105 RepID=A0A9X1IKX7_9GAMM|nr:GGDEF domain-containing protein [Marinomonas algarum]MCB5161152.1 diguanylate cyclase [Marinomonas algarum]
MTPSTLYFSPCLIHCTDSLHHLLIDAGTKVQWQPVETLQQVPVSAIVLMAAEELKEEEWPQLGARKALVIVDDWTLESSLNWIQRGATNCFSQQDQHLVTWLAAELSRFNLGKAQQSEDDVLQVIIDAIPTPIFFKDHLHIYRGCNLAFCNAIGFAREKIIGHSVYDISPKALADKYYEADSKLLSQGGTQRYEANVQFSNGSLHEIEFNKAVFTNADGQAIGQVGVMLDITERNQLMRQLDTSTRTDPLTHLKNRRAFNTDIHHSFEQLKQKQQTLSLMTLDIDFFKSINDRFGHSGGDQALQLVAQWMTEQIRATDNLYRVGGEEFYILMHNTNISMARTLAERICKDTSVRLFTIKEQDIHITLSIGVTEINPTVDLDSTLEMVDKALYEAKADGRNCVRCVFE